MILMMMMRNWMNKIDGILPLFLFFIIKTKMFEMQKYFENLEQFINLCTFKTPII